MSDYFGRRFINRFTRQTQLELKKERMRLVPAYRQGPDRLEIGLQFGHRRLQRVYPCGAHCTGAEAGCGEAWIFQRLCIQIHCSGCRNSMRSIAAL